MTTASYHTCPRLREGDTLVVRVDRTSDGLLRFQPISRPKREKKEDKRFAKNQLTFGFMK